MQWPALEQKKPLKFFGNGEVNGQVESITKKISSPKKGGNSGHQAAEEAEGGAY